jgi:hypothetical protein
MYAILLYFAGNLIQLHSLGISHPILAILPHFRFAKGGWVMTPNTQIIHILGTALVKPGGCKLPYNHDGPQWPDFRMALKFGVRVDPPPS